MQRGGTEINNLQFPPRHYRGTRQADCEHDAVCSAAAAAGSTGHDGSGNDSLPSPHNQSPHLNLCFAPPVANLRHGHTVFDVGTCRLLAASPLYSR